MKMELMSSKVNHQQNKFPKLKEKELTQVLSKSSLSKKPHTER